MTLPPNSGVSPQGSSRVGLSPGAETFLLVVIVAVFLAAPLLILILPAELSPLEADGGDPFSDLSASAVGTALAAFALMGWGMLLMLAPARRLSAQRPLPSRAPWGALDVAIVLCPIIVLIGLPALLDEPEGSAPRAADVLAGSAVLWLMMTFVQLVVLRRRHGLSASALGLHTQGWRPALIWSPLFYLCALPLIAGATLLGLLVHTLAGVTIDPHPMSPFLTEHASTAVKISAILAVVVVAPIGEEILFRGFLYPAFRRWVGPRIALALSAALFASLHPSLGYFYSLLILGGIFAYLYERTGTLIAPIAIHSLHNGLIVTLALLFGESIG